MSDGERTHTGRRQTLSGVRQWRYPPHYCVATVMIKKPSTEKNLSNSSPQKWVLVYLHVLVHDERWCIKSCEGDEYDAVEMNETTVTNVAATKQQD